MSLYRRRNLFNGFILFDVELGNNSVWLVRNSLIKLQLTPEIRIYPVFVTILVPQWNAMTDPEIKFPLNKDPQIGQTFVILVEFLIVGFFILSPLII